MVNKGIFREDEMIAYLDGKKVFALNDNLRCMMEALFGILDDNETIECGVVMDFAKADFYITYCGETKYISMKSGEAKNFHSEDIISFSKYLKEIGFSDETIQTVLLFHFGDGTIDGTGTTRYDYNFLMRNLEDRIFDANEELNQDKDVILEIIKRTVFGEYDTDKPSADAIYYGNVKKGYLATKYQILAHIKRKSWDTLYSLHIGPLMIKPHARYVNVDIKDETREKRRRTVELAWINFVKDIQYISSSYSNYIPRRRVSPDRKAK